MKNYFSLVKEKMNLLIGKTMSSNTQHWWELGYKQSK